MSENEKIAIGIFVSLIFITLVIVFCVKLVTLYIKKTKEQYIKDMAYNEKELAFQETLNKTIIETQEQVLHNISQDLHDDAGQQLTSINFQLENLKLDSSELEKTLEPISKSLGHLSQSIRGISHSLNNQVLLQKDLVKAIESDVKRLKKNKKVSIEFTFEKISDKTFSSNERIFIYRIFQECISNCLKHSKASTINITIRTKPEFEMVFRDNGVGFDSNASVGKVSMGLNNMNTRAKNIGYLLNIDSKIGVGTTISLIETKPE